MSNPRRTVVVLAGDGVGPEVTTPAVAILRDACDHAGIDLAIERRLAGGAATDAEGAAISDATIEACRNADAILFGAVGGPEWGHLRDHRRPGAGLLRLRRELELFANVRPVCVTSALARHSLLDADAVAGTDFVIVRELIGGLYFGTPRTREGSGDGEEALDSLRYSRREIARVVRFAQRLAAGRRGRMVSVDKANVLITSQLWRDTVEQLREETPGVTVEHQLVDSATLRLLQAPRELDVIVTENLFGDILSSEASALAGSGGVLPSMSAGERGPALYEPVHGSAPDIAGQGIANPVGAILSVAMLLEHSFSRPEIAGALRDAVDAVIESGTVTPDLGGAATTAEVSDAVRAGFATALARGRAAAGAAS